MKSHMFFKPITWALLRHMKPPMIPHAGRAIDTVNFRNVKESGSIDISASRWKGVPMDSGLATPVGEVVADPFEDFNSVTLHHDDEDDHHQTIPEGLVMNGHHR